MGFMILLLLVALAPLALIVAGWLLVFGLFIFWLFALFGALGRLVFVRRAGEE